MKDIDWYRVMSAALTVIRVKFPVATLQRLEAEGSETAVNGDELARWKADRWPDSGVLKAADPHHWSYRGGHP